MVKQENDAAFIKAFSSKPETVRRGGLSELQKSMVAMHIPKLVLMPRISGAVANSLDGAGKGTLQVAERLVDFPEDVGRMH